MRRYGLRIGDFGIEFASRDERQKAMLAFTAGTCVTISDSGIRFKDAKGAFSTYERDDKEVLATCRKCGGVFGIDACADRDYPELQSWDHKWVLTSGHICDACFESQRKAKELADAKATVQKAEAASETF